MKKLIPIFLLLALLSCNKDDKVQTKYRVEGTGVNIEAFYCTSEDFSPLQNWDYNLPTYSHEWIGKNKNEIYFSITTGDQSGTVRLYVDDELVKEYSAVGLENGAYLKWEN